MNNKPFLIAIVCGLLTAFMLLAPTRLGFVGGLLSIIAVLPLFVSALGFGTIAGGISGLVAATIVAAFVGLLPALASFFFTLLPAVWLGHMAGLVNREDGQEFWFPLSTILFRMALLSAGLVIALGYVSGYDGSALIDQLAKVYKEFYTGVAQQNADATIPSDTALQATATQIVKLLPVLMPASLLLMYLFNLSLGARYARARGWMLRPRDAIADNTSLPFMAVGIFAVAVVATMLGGPVGLIGKVIAGALGCAFMLVGFAVLHVMTRGIPGRTGLLFFAYAFTFFSLFPAFLFVIVGLAETLLGIRARRTSGV